MSEWSTSPDRALIARIYQVVAQVPHGTVATYGDIAAVVGDCDARTVGTALQHLPRDHEKTVPWQRVINASGGISTHGPRQRELLAREGVPFDPHGHVVLARCRWTGPRAGWAEEHGFHTLPPPAPVPPEQEEHGQLRLF
jgi:methylated-DNA-protein-cysteine methyltransferase-like protein